MKLKIGENIRRLRRAAGMSQEECATRVGVSGQAVSRWETEAAYPDIELLPSIADLFGVGVEELMGARNIDRERASEAAYAHLATLTGPAERLSYLREMHREFPRDRTVMLRIALHTEDLDEMRTMVERLDALSDERKNDFFLIQAVRRLFAREDESRLPVLIDSYTTPLGFSREILLEERYLAQKEYDRYEILREQDFLWFFHNLTGRLRWDPEPVRHVTTSLWSSRTLLAMVNLLCGISSEDAARHPVSGDGVPDLWYYVRLHAGFRLSCQLAFIGQEEESLAALEDATALYEAFWSLPEGSKLTYRCPTLYRLTGVLHKELHWDGQGRQIVGEHPDTPILPRQLSPRYLSDSDNRTSAELFFFFREYQPLTVPTGWEWFDPIRNHPRFLACLERMKAFDRPEIYPVG